MKNNFINNIMILTKEHLQKALEESSIDVLPSRLEVLHQALLKEIHKDRIVKFQTIPENSKVEFRLKDRSQWPTDQAAILNILYENHGVTVPAKATVLTLSGWHNLGDINGEFYDIQFEDGLILQGISGYHLKIIE